MFGWRKPSTKPDTTRPAPTPALGAEPYLPSEITGQDAPSSISDLLPLLEAIEALAGRIYADHGLPSQRGHYRRSAQGGGWDLVSSSLTPAEKFDLVLAAPEQGRLHYAALDRLGAKHESPLVRQAAALLAAAQGIRHKLDSNAPFTAQSLADSIRMGALYQSLAARIPDFEAVDLLAAPAPSEPSSGGSSAP